MIYDFTGQSFQLRAHDSTTHYVGWSVDLSVTICFFSVFGIFGRLLHYCSCQMLDLACFITAPAHPHATSVAMYPACSPSNPPPGLKSYQRGPESAFSGLIWSQRGLFDHISSAWTSNQPSQGTNQTPLASISPLRPHIWLHRPLIAPVRL